MRNKAGGKIPVKAPGTQSCGRNFAIILLFPFLFFSCAPKRISGGDAASTPGQPVFTDALGRRYAQKEIPCRIVSLNPATTEILFAIGAGEKVVGVTQYCDYPPETSTRTSVGGFSGATVSLEQVRSLEPDLVILSADMHSRIISLLDGLGIASFSVEPRNFSQVYDVIALLGEITGCVPGAEGVIAEMKSKIDGVEERIKGLKQPTVFWILGEDPLMTTGPDTFVSETIRLGGGRNIFDDVHEQWPLVSPEQVLVRKPEWIFREAPAQRSSLFNNPLWQAVPAVREGHVEFINPDILYRYGPRLADAVVAVAEILHPKFDTIIK